MEWLDPSLPLLGRMIRAARVRREAGFEVVRKGSPLIIPRSRNGHYFRLFHPPSLLS